mmetsp:Transcript_115725/g.314261  ORF Transcript_115725/g.314261 Transcript_115725/m.314261 type:complete len:346 (+) Transcript_115725:45-1082(+)
MVPDGRPHGSQSPPAPTRATCSSDIVSAPSESSSEPWSLDSSGTAVLRPKTKLLSGGRLKLAMRPFRVTIPQKEPSASTTLATRTPALAKRLYMREPGMLYRTVCGGLSASCSTCTMPSEALCDDAVRPTGGRGERSAGRRPFSGELDDEPPVAKRRGVCQGDCPVLINQALSPPKPSWPAENLCGLTDCVTCVSCRCEAIAASRRARVAKPMQRSPGPMTGKSSTSQARASSTTRTDASGGSRAGPGSSKPRGCVQRSRAWMCMSSSSRRAGSSAGRKGMPFERICSSSKLFVLIIWLMSSATVTLTIKGGTRLGSLAHPLMNTITATAICLKPLSMAALPTIA